MKNKFITLLLAGTLVLSNTAVAFAAEVPGGDQSSQTAIEETQTVEETETTEETEEVKEAEAVVEEQTTKEAPEAKAAFQYAKNAGDALEDKNGVIIDIRNTGNFGYNNLIGSVNIPLFDENNKLPEDLHTAFVKAMNDKKAEIGDKNVYILCNKGLTGAETAVTALAEECGYDASKLFIIKGGAAEATPYLRYVYVSNQEAMDAYLAGSEVIDLRAQEVYDAGHLVGAKYLPVFGAGSKLDTPEAVELQKTFTKEIKGIVDNAKGNVVYVLCNSGNSGARKAVDLAVEAGLSKEQVKIITGGAKDAPFSIGVNAKSVSQEDALAIAAKADENTVIFDLRPFAEYQTGHLKYSVSLPVFGANSSLTDDAAKANQAAFSKYVAEHKAELAGKKIYVLCYRGNKGALEATLLLADAGLTDNVYTITGGFKGIQEDTDSYSLRYVDASYAINNPNGLVIDVRNSGLYAEGHLKGSISLPVFDKDNALDSKEAKDAQAAFRAYVEANKDSLAKKDLYILCNSGKRGADLATEILAEYGLTAKTIDRGATSEYVKANFEATKTEETKQPEKTTNTKDEPKKDGATPKTGDTANALPYVAVMGAAVLALVGRKKFF